MSKYHFLFFIFLILFVLIDCIEQQGEPSGNCACYDYTYFEFARGPGQYIWLTMGAIEKDGQCSFRRFSPGSIEAGWGHYSGIDYSVVHSSLTGEHGADQGSSFFNGVLLDVERNI